jgi:tetratricopeptide (TPR) repeat protein
LAAHADTDGKIVIAMDRTSLAACALLLAPVAFGVGCGAKPTPVPADHAPLVLAELQQASPGPWRRITGAEVAPTSLERPVIDPVGPSAGFDPSDLGDLQSRLEGTVPTVPAVEGASEAAPSGPLSEMPPADSSPAAPSRVETGAFPDLIDPTPAPSIAAAAPAPLSEPMPAVPAIGVPRTLEGTLPPPAASSERLPTTAEPLPEERGTLPWAGTSAPSPEMRAVFEQAEERLRQGFRLAERGALYLARAEFVGVMELIAQANDLQRGTQFYTQSLTAGLLALEESRDFVRVRPIGKQLDIELIVSGHRTQILKEEDFEAISPLVAARRYYTYAQEQLAGAAAGEARCSIALYGLGKAATTSGEASPAERMEWMAQAMVLHQAALMADRANFRAANELGVILARNGDWLHARNLLVHSVRLSPHPSTFRNLAVAHTRLGETQLAAAASQQALALERTGRHSRGPAVQWVDPVTFAGSAPPSNMVMPPVAQKGAGTAPAATEAPPAPVSTARKSSSDWLPWKR